MDHQKLVRRVNCLYSFMVLCAAGIISIYIIMLIDSQVTASNIKEIKEAHQSHVDSANRAIYEHSLILNKIQ